MSYILDALKKSERERSLGSLRKLSTPTPGAARGERRVVWILLVVLVVLIALLATMAWWYREPIGALLRNDPAPAASPDTLSPAREPRADPRVIDSTREVGPAQSAAEPPSPLLSPSDADADPEPNASAANAGHVPSAGPAVPVSELPAALRERLPPLSVSVVSWSGDAPRRFVMIDGGIYKEGERLPAGIRVEKIMRERIELSMLSERFYILP